MSTETTRAILKAKGYTASTLAADLEVSRSIANRILNGKNGLYFGDLCLLHTKLGISISFLLGRPGYAAEARRRDAVEEQAAAD